MFVCAHALMTREREEGSFLFKIPRAGTKSWTVIEDRTKTNTKKWKNIDKSFHVNICSRGKNRSMFSCPSNFSSQGYAETFEKCNFLRSNCVIYCVISFFVFIQSDCKFEKFRSKSPSYCVKNTLFKCFCVTMRIAAWFYAGLPSSYCKNSVVLPPF